MKFLATSFGPGSFVRFKSLKSHNWHYAIYRGVEKNEGRSVAYAEDRGLPQSVIEKCHHLVMLDSIQPQSMNVATAGSIVIYDRHIKAMKRQPHARALAVVGSTPEGQKDA